MLYSALDFASDGISERRREPVVVRTMLAGRFAAAGHSHRPMIEGLLAEPVRGRTHRLLAEGRTGCAQGPSSGSSPGHHEDALMAQRADLVLLDLDGPLVVVLALVGRLRAAAGANVAFIGILPGDASPAARLYLSAVVDAVVHGPLRAASLHRAVADALPTVDADASDPAVAGTATRH